MDEMHYLKSDCLCNLPSVVIKLKQECPSESAITISGVDKYQDFTGTGLSVSSPANLQRASNYTNAALMPFLPQWEQMTPL